MLQPKPALGAPIAWVRAHLLAYPRVVQARGSRGAWSATQAHCHDVFEAFSVALAARLWMDDHGDGGSAEAFGRRRLSHSIRAVGAVASARVLRAERSRAPERRESPRCPLMPTRARVHQSLRCDVFWPCDEFCAEILFCGLGSTTQRVQCYNCSYRRTSCARASGPRADEHDVVPRRPARAEHGHGATSRTGVLRHGVRAP